MSDLAIRVENLGKQYRIGAKQERYNRFTEQVMDSITAPIRRVKQALQRSNVQTSSRSNDIIWALKDVSFEVERGEVVGIIGRNGAGKSTLLKILSRITEPTTGRVELHGRVSSLLEVGTGFHPELTGRENVYLNGAILGMRREEIEHKFDEIVEFSGVEQFLDTPVKRYSSGMQVRLAFAVAAHLEPEILLVDEVLAVGDAEFQRKCLGKMGEVAGQGRTVLFVSHSMGAVENLCPRAILFQYGKLTLDALTADVTAAYLSQLRKPTCKAFCPDNPDRSGTREIALAGARLLNDAGEAISLVVAGQPLTLEFGYENRVRSSHASLSLNIFNHLGAAVTNLNTSLTGDTITGLGRRGVFRCRIDDVPFAPGQYRVAIAVSIDGHQSDLVPNALMFDVEASSFYETGRSPAIGRCAVLVRHRWTHIGTAVGPWQNC